MRAKKAPEEPDKDGQRLQKEDDDRKKKRTWQGEESTAGGHPSVATGAASDKQGGARGGVIAFAVTSEATPVNAPFTMELLAKISINGDAIMVVLCGLVYGCWYSYGVVWSIYVAAVPQEMRTQPPVDAMTLKIVTRLVHVAR